jgi:hypothetical protein
MVAGRVTGGGMRRDEGEGMINERVLRGGGVIDRRRVPGVEPDR